MTKSLKAIKTPKHIAYTVKARIITVAQATQMLKHNSYNRPLNHVKCKKYAEQMQTGSFMRNGDTICFDWNNVLIDGQNRLTAIVDSGLPLDTIVVTGLDPKAFNTIDIGKVRTLAQLLAKEGAKHSQIAAGMTAALINYNNGLAPYHSTTNLAGYDDHEKRIKYFKDNRMFLEPSMDFVVNHSNSLVGLNKSRFAFLYHIMACLDYDEAQQFFFAFFGDPSINISVAHNLRARFVKDAYHTIKSSQMTDKKKMALFIKAWNSYRPGPHNGKQVSYKDGGDNPESFPQAI